MGKSHLRNKRHKSRPAAHHKFLNRDAVPKPKEVLIMPKGMNTVTGPVLKFLNERRGLQVTIHELVEATGLEEDKIRASLSYLRSKLFSIDTVVTGQCWIYRSAPVGEVVKEAPPVAIHEKPTVTVPLDERPGLVTSPPVDNKPKFTMPAISKDVEFFRVISRNEERVLLEDASGKIYKATEI